MERSLARGHHPRKSTSPDRGREHRHTAEHSKDNEKDRANDYVRDEARKRKRDEPLKG